MLTLFLPAYFYFSGNTFQVVVVVLLLLSRLLALWKAVKLQSNRQPTTAISAFSFLATDGVV